MTKFRVYYLDRSATYPDEKGQVAIMVESIPDKPKQLPRERRNIWTIPKKHATKEVLAAIQYAFNAGKEIQLLQLNDLLWDRTLYVQAEGKDDEDFGKIQIEG